MKKLATIELLYAATSRETDGIVLEIRLDQYGVPFVIEAGRPGHERTEGKDTGVKCACGESIALFVECER